MKSATQSTGRARFLDILFIMALLMFILIAAYIHICPENIFDKEIQDILHPLATPALIPFWTRITLFGAFEFLFPAWLVFIMIQVRQRKVRFGLSVMGLALGSFLSVHLLKEIFRRYRPPAPLIPNMINYSFPSGHCASSFIFCAVLTYSLWHSNVSQTFRIAGMTLLAALTFSVGLSRIVLTVHYPTDVTAGFCFGALWMIGWLKFLSFIGDKGA